MKKLVSEFQSQQAVPNAQSQNLITSNIKLPQMNLREFDGSYSDWLQFKDTFIALVHENKSLTDIQKLY